MKYCSHCGAQIEDEAVICIHCGCAVFGKINPKNNSSTLKTVAKIFMLLGCIASAFLWLVPLCWTIPITVKYWRDVAYHRPTSVAFKVCSLFFVNVIAGILMLCDNDE